MAGAWSERALTCVKTPTSAHDLAQECRMCIDGDAGRPAGRSVIAHYEDMYCEQNVNNACYESIGKLYSEL